VDEGTNTMYTLGADNNLYTFNPATGASALVGPTGVNFNYRMGLAYNPMDEQLYALGDDTGTNNNLYIINKATGAATLVGPTALGEADAIEFVPGVQFDDFVMALGLAPAAEAPLAAVGADSNAEAGTQPALPDAENLLAAGLPRLMTSADPGDYYRVEMLAGQTLTLSTSTPFGEPGFPRQVLNGLDPKLELYDPAGNLVAFNDDSAADGKNALLTYTALASGAYCVRVLGVGETTGEYVLTAAAPHASVVGRYIFYNQSAFDGNNPPPTSWTMERSPRLPRDSNWDQPFKELGKQALLPGQTATFLNYTSYSLGINGIMVDVAGLANPAGMDPTDFVFGSAIPTPRALGRSPLFSPA